jgi:glycosidase
MRNNPLLYQVNARPYINALGAALGRQATLDDVPDEDIDAIARLGFEWVYLLSVWEVGEAGSALDRGDAALREKFKAALPDLADGDIGGSGFAVADYKVNPDLGGPEALARLRVRLAQRGLFLMLDFVPNHMALDCAWLPEHPEYFLTGTSDALAAWPHNYQMVATARGAMILAHGRDPNFDGWADTLQLDYTNLGLQAKQVETLLGIAAQCDGVRCDMAMLLLPDVFERTWGLRPLPFWKNAIAAVRAKYHSFTFMTEAYWDLESALLDEGFDFAYDKRLYDRLRECNATAVREHLNRASLSYQTKLVRFLENHDEARAALVFPPGVHEAAAAITFLAPGLRFFQRGEVSGAKVHLPVQLVREPVEPVDETLKAFYTRLLAALERPVVRDGHWLAIDPIRAWDGNESFNNFVAFGWELTRDSGTSRILVVVNYGPTQAQCYLSLPFSGLEEKTVHLIDLMGTEHYHREGSALIDRGLYVDLAAWRYNAFELVVD